MANYKDWWKDRGFLLYASPTIESKFPIINKIKLSYNLMEDYVSPFLQIKLKFLKML
jgi:hypothetical protein